jgi:predicted amidohydrolase YtcJ
MNSKARLVYFLFFFAIGCGSKPTADIVLLNGNVWLSEANTFAEALAIQRNKIIAVGTSEEIQKLVGETTHVIELKGKLVIPGFNDAHIHFLNGSIGLSEVQIVEAKTLEAVTTAIKVFAKNNPTKQWISGSGWQ